MGCLQHQTVGCKRAAGNGFAEIGLSQLHPAATLLFDSCTRNHIETLDSTANFMRFAQAVLDGSKAESEFHIDLDSREDADQAMFAFQRLGCVVERDLAGLRLFIKSPQ